MIGSKTAAAGLVLAMLAGCTVLPLEEDKRLREIRAGTFDADYYAKSRWNSEIMPALEAQVVPLAQLAVVANSDLAEVGRKFGRRAGEGAAWAFVVSGEGTVRAVNSKSRRGIVMLAIPGKGGEHTVLMQSGPVVSGSAVRDALPSIKFDDFSDQVAFAEVGNALTEQALRQTEPMLRAVRPGHKLQFTAVASLSNSGDPLLLTPVRIVLRP